MTTQHVSTRTTPTTNTAHPTAKVVGLTGGIGSGKSQVRKYFESLGVPAWDADLVAREIHQNPAHPVISALVSRFGDVLSPEGAMDRMKMRALLAADPSVNADLKGLLGPFVIQELQRQAAAANAPYVVWESALIIDEKIPVDRVLVIDCAVETQIARVKLRNPDWPVNHIEHMLSLQLSREQRLLYADDVLENESTPEHLYVRVKEQHQKYLTLWSNK